MKKKSRYYQPRTKPKHENKKPFDFFDKLTAFLVLLGAVLASAFGSDGLHRMMVSTVFLTISIALFDLFRHSLHRARWLFFTVLTLVSLAACIGWDMRKPDRNKDRPIVFVKTISLDEPLTAGKEPAITFTLGNSGSMEAEVRFWDCTAYFEASSGRGPRPAYAKTDEISSLLAPTGEAIVRMRFPSINLTADEIKQIIERRSKLYGFARGEYKDELGRIWPFPFCRIYDPGFPGSIRPLTGGASYAPSWNRK
jgi:hypothetical protein